MAFGVWGLFMDEAVQIRTLNPTRSAKTCPSNKNFYEEAKTGNRTNHVFEGDEP